MDWSHLREMLTLIGEIGRTSEGGITRLLFSPEYDRAAGLLMDYMKEAGLKTYRDTAGNIHGILTGTSGDGSELFVGSHLDTVTEGGLYDGALGVIAAVECAGKLPADGIKPAHGLHIVATNGEEGNDLGGTFGSRCMMGLVDPDKPGYMDIAGKYGITREDILGARLDTGRAMGYLELHIEQGKTLDETGDDIGAVTGIVGLRRLAAVIKGEANHAGTTMMEFRRDALVGAARLITLVDNLARSFGGGLVATVGRCNIFPNSAPVIPGRAELVIEYRSLSSDNMDKFEVLLRNGAAEIPYVDIAFEPIVEKAPVVCDSRFGSLISEAAQKRGLAWRYMPSGATHDGNAFAMRMPIGMIFVPSKGGISHNKNEYTDWTHICHGADVLYDTILSIIKE